MTTIVAKKRRQPVKPATIKPRPPQGAEARRGAGGVIEMIEFGEYRPNPTAPTILVDRVCGIYHHSGLIKCTFGLELPGMAGIRSVDERVSLLWQPPAVLSANEAFVWAFEEFRKGTFRAADDGGFVPRRSRTQ